MPTMNLGLDGASIAIKIRNRRNNTDKTYVLTAPHQGISTAGSPPRDLGPIKFLYKEAFEDAIDMGTLSDFMEEFQGLVTSVTPPAGQKFIDQWHGIQQQLANAPILGNAITTMGDTDVRIVQIELELTRQADPDPPDPQNPPPVYKGRFALGLMFAPDVNSRPRLFNIEIVSFGAVVSVELEGNIGLGGTRP